MPLITLDLLVLIDENKCPFAGIFGLRLVPTALQFGWPLLRVDDEMVDTIRPILILR
jgi:hypothetical protein